MSTAGWIVLSLCVGVLLLALPARAGRAKNAPKPAAFVPPSATPEAFEVSLALIGEASVDKVSLELTVRNHADGPRVMCTYYTPFEGFLNDILEVHGEDGERVRFSGPLASRLPPGPADYVTLAAGEARSVRFNLTSHYPLVAGSYRVRVSNGLGSLPASNTMTITIPKDATVARSGWLVTLTPAPAASAAHGVLATLTVKNVSATPRRFCKYHTPFEGTRNDFLEVLDSDGKALEYAGMMAKRAPPGKDDYLEVGPGRAVEQRFDLRDGRSFRAGTYRVRFTGGDISGLGDSAFTTLVVKP